jgi:hypothetical protein
VLRAGATLSGTLRLLSVNPPSRANNVASRRIFLSAVTFAASVRAVQISSARTVSLAVVGVLPAVRVSAVPVSVFPVAVFLFDYEKAVLVF